MEADYLKYLPADKNFRFTDISEFGDGNTDLEIKEDGCLVSNGLFHFAPNPYKYVEECFLLMDKNAYFLLIDKIVDVDDAQKNTSAYFQNSNHRRYYRVEEIIDFTKEYFRMEYFCRCADDGLFLFKKI